MKLNKTHTPNSIRIDHNNVMVKKDACSKTLCFDSNIRNLDMIRPDAKENLLVSKWAEEGHERLAFESDHRCTHLW